MAESMQTSKDKAAVGILQCCPINTKARQCITRPAPGAPSKAAIQSGPPCSGERSSAQHSKEADNVSPRGAENVSSRHSMVCQHARASPERLDHRKLLTSRPATSPTCNTKLAHHQAPGQCVPCCATAPPCSSQHRFTRGPSARLRADASCRLRAAALHQACACVQHWLHAESKGQQCPCLCCGAPAKRSNGSRSLGRAPQGAAVAGWGAGRVHGSGSHSEHPAVGARCGCPPATYRPRCVWSQAHVPGLSWQALF